MKTCKVDECEKSVTCRDYCRNHYANALRIGTIERLTGNVECSIDGCRQVATAKTYCRKHYLRNKKYGDPLHRTTHDPNKIIISGKIAVIQMYDKNCEKTKQAIIDSDDVKKVLGIKWKFKASNGGAHGSSGRGTFYILSRFIMDCDNKDLIVDHINFDRLDNRKSNLRICSVEESLRYRRILKETQTGMKGVRFNKNGKRYIASINPKSGFKYLGVYDSIDEAARAYNNAAMEHYGEFAVLNEV